MAFTVVWGWHGHASLTRETFATKRSAWERVKALFAKNPTTLQVYEPAPLPGKPDARKQHTFRKYIPGCELCRWGDWGISTAHLSGETFG